ncbi:MAG: LacI family transcriptional regulator [Chloroflexi bacterium]|nr:LacI family transcriptional regulator [Chloroflexota bacterium]
MPPVTIKDVAAQAGVSYQTVSRVINNKPEVAAETRQKVLQVIKELDYQPNVLAGSLRRRETLTIALIIPDTFNPFFAEVAKGVEETGFQFGYSLVLCHSDYDAQKELRYVHVLRSKRVDGVILIPSSPASEALQVLLKHKIPVVLADRKPMDMASEVDTVTADNTQGARAATEHLIRLGHRRIAFIARPFPMTHSAGRLHGYRLALEQHGLPFVEEMVVHGGFRYPAGEEAMQHLLSLKPPITAVLAYNDIMAIGALKAISDRGLSVPRDISVVGFDDIPPAAYTDPPLTTVAMPKVEMGRIAAQRLMQMVDSGPGAEKKDIVLETHLVVRGSTAPPPSL